MTRGYNSYHGRDRRMRSLLVLLLAILLLGSLGYMFVQNNLVYDSEGNVSLNLPFFSKEDQADPPVSGTSNTGSDNSVDDNFNLIIEQPEQSPPPVTEEKAEQPLRAVEKPIAEFRSEPAPGADSNAVVVELKDSVGTLAYQSALAAEGAKAADAASRSSLKEILSAERDWTAVAALHTLHDTYYAFANMAGAGICQSSGYIWYDYSNSHWLQPEKEGAKSYFYAVAQECEEMGFDELLLREFMYPVQGKLYKIDYSGMTLTKGEALREFLSGLREVLDEKTVLSLQLDEELILAGSNAESGQDISMLVPLVDRVWVETDDPDAVWAALEPHLPEGTKRELFLVVIGAEPSAEGSVLLTAKK